MLDIKGFIQNYSSSFFLIVTLMVTFSAYYPGLTGGFLFDDYENINKLGTYDPMSSSIGFNQYLVSAETRPLAFLSFLLNDTYWPSNNPSSFILTNILFHLLSGLLLIWLVLKTSLILELTLKEAQWIAVLSGAFWLLHPFLVSTTLYIVQRMTILAVLFTFASLLCYTHGRLLLQKNINIKAGYLWLTFGVIVFALIAVSSKEIATLTPCFLFLFETILFKKKIPGAFFSYWKICFIYIPVIIIIAFFFYIPYTRFWLTYELRDFTLIERLLTEARVLIYYLYSIIIPKSQNFGLHYENIELSTSLVTPITTLLSVSLIFCLILGSILYRKKHPVLSFSVLFFFTGHVIESTIIPLEIYFEHRNYLPSCFLFFALSYYLVTLYKKNHLKSIALASLILTTYSSLTFSRASLWGNPLLLMSVWTETNQGSVRNYTGSSMVATQFHRHDLALLFIEKGMKALPNDPYINLWHLQNNCHKESFNEIEYDKLLAIIKSTKKIKTVYIYKNLKLLVDRFNEKKCPAISYKKLTTLLHSALTNPNISFSLRRSEIYHLLGKAALAEKDYQEASLQFKTAFLELPHSGTALLQTAQLASAEQYDFALKHVQFTHQLLKKNQLLSDNDQFNFKDLEQRIVSAINKRDNN